MLAGVVNDHWPVGNCAIEKLMRRHRGRHGAEVGAANKHLVIGMIRCEGFDLRDNRVGIVWGNAGLGRRQIEAVQFHGAEPHVRVGIGDAGNHGLPA